MTRSSFRYTVSIALVCVALLAQACAMETSRRRTAAATDPTTWGILDITRPPYSADPSGHSDSTNAIQQAVNDARDRRMITFFPPGVYLVSRTVIASQETRTKPEPLLGRRDDYPCILWGGTRGGRATIRLADKAPGFGDPEHPKPVIYFLSLKPDSQPYNPNISFNQMILSLDVDLGSGNAGAIGVDHQGAQGSVTEDVHVRAEGAFAGFRGAVGSGGGVSHISVTGGRYGLYLAGMGLLDSYAGSQPVPVISYADLKGQTELAVLSDVRGPLTLVGVSIDGAGIRLAGSRAPFNGALNMVDSVIRYRGSGAAITGNRPVYLSNVYFDNTARLVAVDGVPVLEGGPGWFRVVEYAAGPSDLYPVWSNGKKRRSPRLWAVRPEPPPKDLRRRHHWLEPLPNWDDPGVANVKAPPYSARGDGATDDTAAIQRALDESRDVFLPAGHYRISRPLWLRADSRLFGLGVHSKIEPLPESAAFRDPGHPSPMLVTPDDAAARCVAAFFQLWCRWPGSYAIHWRAGRHSMVRNVRTKSWPWPKGAAPADHAIILIDGHGGGRWYNALMHQKFPQTLRHRHVLVRSTREPLTFYMLNPEHSNADYMVEFDDVRHVDVYSVKTETLGAGGPRELTPVLIRNSADFRIFGQGGNGSAAPGESLYCIRNSTGYVLANFTYQYFREASPASLWYMVEETTPGGSLIRTPATEFFTCYKRSSQRGGPGPGSRNRKAPRPTIGKSH